MKLKLFLLVPVLALLAVLLPGGESAGAADPTCSTTLGIAVHGQHIVHDYVTGLGSGTTTWPPGGGVVGETTGANGGAMVPGGPGPGFHFQHGFAPGASFCLLQSKSPGTHLGP
jgi:hypothetical protein